MSIFRNEPDNFCWSPINPMSLLFNFSCRDLWKQVLSFSCPAESHGTPVYYILKDGYVLQLLLISEEKHLGIEFEV